MPMCSLTSQGIFSKCAAKVLLFSEPAKLFRLFLLKYPKKVHQTTVVSD